MRGRQLSDKHGEEKYVDAKHSKKEQIADHSVKSVAHTFIHFHSLKQSLGSHYNEVVHLLNNNQKSLLLTTAQLTLHCEIPSSQSDCT